MKKLFLTLIVCLIGIVPVFSQQVSIDEKTIANMSESELSAYQKTLRAQQRQNESKTDLPSPSKLQEYALVGKALGQAFKECWTTVSGDAEKFAQSPAGKWTAFLITWKVMGQDAIDIMKTSVRWVIGSCIYAIGIPFFVFLTWRNCITRKQLDSIERTGIFTWKKTYKKDMYVPYHCNEGLFLYGMSFAIFFMMVYLTMFL